MSIEEGTEIYQVNEQGQPIAKIPDYDRFVKNEEILQSQSEEPIIKQPTLEDIRAAWDILMKRAPLFAQPELTQPLCSHTYMFSLNANHTLVRGCIHCGETYATLVIGDPEDLQWHIVKEPEEQGGE